MSVWFLPGGGVGSGEHPAEAVLREVREETGCYIHLSGALAVLADTVERTGTRLHAIRLVYASRLAGGERRHERSGSTDQAAWFW